MQDFVKGKILLLFVLITFAVTEFKTGLAVIGSFFTFFFAIGFKFCPKGGC
jgi:hypothetical protein